MHLNHQTFISPQHIVVHHFYVIFKEKYFRVAENETKMSGSDVRIDEVQQKDKLLSHKQTTAPKRKRSKSTDEQVTLIIIFKISATPAPPQSNFEVY